jgi:hypothetical protein
MIGLLQKRLFLSGCILFSFACLHAQYEYQPFVKEGKRWCMYGFYDIKETDHDFQYLMQGDTVIGGEVMKKVHLIDEFHFHDNSLHYIGAVKEVGKQVYITYDGKDTPMLLYDFSMKSSSQISYGDGYVFQLDDVYLYLINSTLRYQQTGHRHYSDDATEFIHHTFISFEGIGYILGLDPFLYNLNSRFLGTMVRACYEDEACIIYEGDLGLFYEVEPTYASLLKHRRRWHSHDVITGNEVIQTVLGDTIIYDDESRYYGHLYRKVYCIDKRKYGDTELHYYGAMREEGKKVYLISDGKGKDDRELLFDFGLKIGEQVDVAGCIVRVSETDSIISEGWKYHCLTLHQMENGKDTGRTCHWTEGIGSDCGLLLPLPWDTPTGQLLVVSDDNICIYNQSFANLPNDIIHKIIKEESTIYIYDLYGRRLMQKPEKGVYIENGRKRVVK